MKKKVLAVAVASVLVAPSAFAAQDTSGMHFTSASEGFYASIRARLQSNTGTDDSTADLHHNTSRFGVRGTNDLGGGLEGFYQYEARVDIHNGGTLGTRLGNVGLRGGFGELVAGAFWSNDYNWTHGSTDIANWHSGNFNYTTEREARTVRAVQYTTPDLNGFQAAVRLNFHSEFAPDADGADDTGTTSRTATVNGVEDNNVDVWNIAAIYNVQGFTVAGSYNTIVEGLANADGVEDRESWTARVGYAQDNWYVNAWYGEDNDSDAPGDAYNEDTEIFSVGGGVSVDKVNVYALYDTRENTRGGTVGKETNRGTVGVQYNLGAQSRVWVEYYARDTDGATNEEDTISVGLRHDF